ncbi:papain-like cysteine protease family protein [Nocardia jiangsuensis]|uniref:Papain-like cysteine protease family protein n=1 Tax=Nocardia jiangsuensis TaxID=1691563 RepID=A0ABV8E0T2_9NOCA
MALSATDLSALGETPVTIRSTAFSNVHLRLDATGVTAPADEGGGTVNCRYGAGLTERFRVRPQTDGSFAFESVSFPKVYLRLDGRGVTAQTGTGGGKVNAQFNATAPGPWEKFHARDQADGSFSLESVSFPEVYLRMNGSGVTAATGSGGGTVNAQFGAAGGIHETFVLAMADQRLDFRMQRQEQTLWCWNAATVSTAVYYDPASPWTQGRLANAELERDDCIVGAGAVSPCNQGRWPDTALTRIGRLNVRSNAALTTVQIGAEMARNAPVIVNISWRGGGGHIVAVRGRSVIDGVDYVSVADPWEGDSDITYDAFRNRYQGTGTWTVSYKTQR